MTHPHPGALNSSLSATVPRATGGAASSLSRAAFFLQRVLA